MEKIPEFKPGDLVKIYTKIIEGDKSRTAAFQGVVIQTKGSGVSKTFTVRKISAGIGVERIFPLHSPLITKIEIKKKGKVRKAKLSYLRHTQAKKIKIRKITPDKGGSTEETTPQDEAAKSEEVKTSKEQDVEGTPGEKTVEKV
jgi:large subunit ribosomal protein L19